MSSARKLLDGTPGLYLVTCRELHVHVRVFEESLGGKLGRKRIATVI
jgi:hypothetical protein